MFPDGPGTPNPGEHGAATTSRTDDPAAQASEAETGYSRSTIYLRISQGLFVRPVSLGARAVGFPAGEVAALNTAAHRGKSDDEIRKLVAAPASGAAPKTPA